jgi:hypothetical protein
LTKGEKALKARIPVKLKKEAMAEINRLADREYQKVKDKEINDKLKLEFDKRDYTDNGKVVNFEGDEEND